jgi:YesN/AraC family two-component response regulator
MREKILIVDDDPLICQGLAYVLNSRYDVSTAGSGREALRKIEKEDFNVVLTDLVMPSVSGMDVLKAVKRRSPQTRVIMITAYATVANAIEAMKEGASDYICKPFEVEQVQMAIGRAIKEAAFEREGKSLEQKIGTKTAKLGISKDSVLKTLSNPIRREAMEFLASGSHSFTQILKHLEVDDPTKLSFHLRILKTVKLVKQDANKIYSLTEEGREIARFLMYLDRISGKEGCY